MSNTCAQQRSLDSRTLQTALDEAGWKPKRGEGLADGLNWLVDCAVELRAVKQQHEQLRSRLSLRVDELDELRAKYRKTSMARLRVAGDLRDLQNRHSDLEVKLYEGWKAERGRLQEQIDRLTATKQGYSEALWEIERSASPDGRPRRFSASRHEWCVERAIRARKAWMPCDVCDVSHQCVRAYEEQNRGRIPLKDCHYSPEKRLFQ